MRENISKISVASNEQKQSNSNMQTCGEEERKKSTEAPERDALLKESL